MDSYYILRGIEELLSGILIIQSPLCPLIQLSRYNFTLLSDRSFFLISSIMSLALSLIEEAWKRDEVKPNLVAFSDGVKGVIEFRCIISDSIIKKEERGNHMKYQNSLFGFVQVDRSSSCNLIMGNKVLKITSPV